MSQDVSPDADALQTDDANIRFMMHSKLERSKS